MIDNTLKPLIKQTLGLPSNAANEYLYGSREDGMFGIPSAANDSDIALFDGGFKLLISNDKIIQYLAWDELVEITNWRFDSTNQLNSQNYLNPEVSGRTSDKYKSPWSRSRQASKRLGVEWGISDIGNVELKLGDDFVKDRKRIFRNVKRF